MEQPAHDDTRLESLVHSRNRPATPPKPEGGKRRLPIFIPETVQQLLDGSRTFHAASKVLPARVSWKCIWRLLASGDLGFAEGYLAGQWSTPNIHSFLSAAGCRSNGAALFEGLKPPQPLTKFRHALNRNTRRGSRRNIAAHYDLGNDFYRLWLDSSMTYSSAIYSSPGDTLEDAQRGKLDRVIGLLRLAGGEQVLEIGCGWGGLAGRIMERGDCHVTGLTYRAPNSPMPNANWRSGVSPANPASVTGLSRRQRDL